jgi:hypothetical protein
MTLTLPRQQRAAALDGEIDRSERAGAAARLQERRAAAVDDKDWSCHQILIHLYPGRDAARSAASLSRDLTRRRGS